MTAKLPALAVAGLGQSTANLAAAMHRAAMEPPPLSKAQKKKMVALAALGGLVVVAGLVVAVVIATQPDGASRPPGCRVVRRPGQEPARLGRPAARPKVSPTLGFRIAATEKAAVEASAFTPDGKKLHHRRGR